MSLEHEQLDNVKTCIRVAQVFPPHDEGFIQCKVKQLTTVPTRDGEDYHALSYVWGPPDQFHLILMNGKPFTVRENLFNFLKYAQNHRPNQNLWIDAICIDQRMCKSGITRFRLWMAEVLRLDPNEVSRETIEQIYRVVIRAVDTGVPSVQGAVDCFSSEILELCNSEYWNRLWVMQEILLANKSSSRVICGDYELPWSDLSRYVFRSSPATMLRGKGGRYEKSRLRQLFRDDGYARGYTCDSNELLNIKTALRMSRGTSCFDVRDRIFGILAIVRLGSTYAVEYNMSPLDVFYHSLAHFADDYNIADLCGSLAHALELSEEHLCIGNYRLETINHQRVAAGFQMQILSHTGLYQKFDRRFESEFLKPKLSLRMSEPSHVWSSSRVSSRDPARGKDDAYHRIAALSMRQNSPWADFTSDFDNIPSGWTNRTIPWQLVDRVNH